MTAVKKVFTLGFPWQTQDPFLFCVHHLDMYPKGNENMGPDDDLQGRQIGQDFTIKDGWRMYHGNKIPGFPYHPHRGFETITIAENGFVDHTDSMGGAGRFGAGDVQWMTAGKGILHSEMFPLVHQDQENTLEIFQIWLNLPASSKFVEPHFKMLWNETIPEKVLTDVHGKKTILRVMAGSLHQLNAPEPTPDSWAADPSNMVTIATIKMEANAQFELDASTAGLTRSLYLYHGDEINIEQSSIKINQGVELESDQCITIESGNKPCQLLLLQGKPINEPVVKYGPFVMNTQAEIQEAYRDYQLTKFGGWPWGESEYVHPRDKSRFALHADGREEQQG